MSETTGVLEGMTNKHRMWRQLTGVKVLPDQPSGHGTPSAPLPLWERTQVVPQKDTNVQGTTGMPLQDEVNASSLLEVVYQSPKCTYHKWLCGNS